MFEQSQSIYVSVAHRYWNPRWSAARNQQVYGRNASEEGVGSNLRLHAVLRSEQGASPAAALNHLKSLCDHRCFHTDVAGFSDRASTLENIAVYLGSELAKITPAGAQWESLTVAENESLSCSVRPGENRVRLHERAFNLVLTMEANIDPETGLAYERGAAEQAVREVAAAFAGHATDGHQAWASRLFAALQIKVKSLSELQIDLGSHQTLRVSSKT